MANEAASPEFKVEIVIEALKKGFEYMNIAQIMETIEKGYAADELIRSGIEKLSNDRILEAIRDFEQAIESMPQHALAKSYEALSRLILISGSGEIKDNDNRYHLAKASNNIADVITGLTNIRNQPYSR